MDDTSLHKLLGRTLFALAYLTGITLKIVGHLGDLSWWIVAGWYPAGFVAVIAIALLDRLLDR